MKKYADTKVSTGKKPAKTTRKKTEPLAKKPRVKKEKAAPAKK